MVDCFFAIDTHGDDSTHHTRYYQANTKRLANVVLLLARRLRRRPNIKTASGKRFVFAG